MSSSFLSLLRMLDAVTRLQSEASEKITSFYLKETWRPTKTVMKYTFSQYLTTILAGEQIKLLDPVLLFKR